MIIRIFLILIILISSTFSKEFSVASYNVENFFDLVYDKSEYKEYKPNDKSKWNKKSFDTKLENIVKVIKDMDKDIVALQEIESENAFKLLLEKLPNYKYHIFKKYSNSSVGLAFISKYKIKDEKLIHIKHSKVNRPILKAVFDIDNNDLTIFNNHWPSKRNNENQRVLYAQALQNYIEKLDDELDYIILGDLNSNYNEFETFKYLKLNNTYNITGINDILKTTLDNKFIKKSDILNYKKNIHYNLWLDLKYNERYSYKFKNKNETPDNILVPKSMFDEKNISYINNSFKVFKAEYLIKHGKINRWEIKNGVHQNSGFSDHLPIYASFSTSKKIEIKKDEIKNISDLYDSNDFKLPSSISNIVLLYKSKDIAIIKQKNNRAIFVYKNVDNLEFDKIYKLNIKNIKIFNGLLEITDFDILDETKNIITLESFLLDASKNDILSPRFQNELITNISGVYENYYFYYRFNNQEKKIKVYSKDKTLLPKNGQKITIINAHLGFFQSKPQIILYKKSDYINVN